MTTLYQHRLYCNTEGGWKYVWTDSEDPVTKCPTDTAHEVQPGSEGIIETQAPSTVVIEKEPQRTTNGVGRVDTIVIPVPANSTNSVMKTWPYNIAIYSMTAGVKSSAVDCTLTLHAGPLTPAGVLTAPAAAGSTTLAVSPTVAANAILGMVITLKNGATSETLGELLAIDEGAGTITVETPTTAAFPPGSVVQLTTIAAKDMLFPAVGYVVFGEDRGVARPIPKGRPIEFIVTNPNGAPTSLSVYVSYNY